MLLYAPFTSEQIEKLNKYQSNSFVHPYTCKNGHILIPEKEGLICYKCYYSQNWIHDFSVLEGMYNHKGFEI